MTPDNQLQLDEKELAEEHTRILTANDPNVPSNVTKYNYKDRIFKVDPPGPDDHLMMHLAIDGAAMHDSTEEAKAQVHLEQAKKEDEEAARLAALAKGDADAPDPLGEARKKRGRAPKRRLTHSQTTDLAFASERQANEVGFTEAIEDAFDKVTEAMKLQTSQE